MSDQNIKVGISNKEGQLGFVFTRGGHREGAGRKSMGETKKISLTLTEDMWAKFEQHCADHQLSRSEAIRGLIESHFS